MLSGSTMIVLLAFAGNLMSCRPGKVAAQVNGNPLKEFAGSILNFSNLSNPATDLKKVLEAPSDLIRNPANLLNSPAETLSKLFTAPLAVTEKGIDKATTRIEKVANSTNKVVDKAIDVMPMGHSFEDDYSDLRLEEMGYENLRGPRYFSRDCEFRIACELGLRLKSMTVNPVKDTLKTNKLVNNLQNRYTKALTYGLLNEDCKPYYCLLVQLVGGPRQMAKGMAELLNKVANPELYDKALLPV